VQKYLDEHQCDAEDPEVAKVAVHPATRKWAGITSPFEGGEG